MNPTTAHTLEVPGARLHYDVRLALAGRQLRPGAHPGRGYMFRQVTHHRPDAAALRATSSRVVMAAGTAAAGQLAHQGAVALADLLGAPLVEFPGDHGAFMTSPEAFAKTLRRVLTGRG